MQIRTGSRALVLAVLVVVVSAGCVGLLGDDGATEAPSTTESPTPTSDPSTTETETVTPAPTPTAEPVDPDNPFGQRTVPVVLRDTVEDRDMRQIAERALEYWEENSDQYARYPIEFTLVDESEDHRLEIEFDEAPITCGHTIDTRTTGCANFNRETAPDVSTVTVARNYTDRYTYVTIVHELGHTLGIDHGEEPVEYMAESTGSGLASDTVHVHVTGSHNAAWKRSEVIKALEYYETHPDLTPDDRLDWEMVDDVDEADLIVEFKIGGCFATSGGSCAGATNFEDQHKLVMDSLGSDVVAWHVAYHLAPAFFDDSDIPEELSGETTHEEREQWDG